ncbi:MAG: hypothetical protein R3B69_00200 [Candidatus Paceibacterota bacterium]
MSYKRVTIPGKSGADGQAGADGRSGEDGKSEGVSGARVFTTSGGEGETHIKTIVNGDVVSETHNDAAQASTVRTYRWVDTTTAPSSSASDTGSTSGETVTPDTVGESAGLLEVLAELRLILKNMSATYSKWNTYRQRSLAVLTIMLLVVSLVPSAAFADETDTDPAPVLGCTDLSANNYDPTATEDDGSCAFDPEPVLGCMDESALNYDATATEDDGTCEYVETEEDTTASTTDPDTEDTTASTTASTTDSTSDGNDTGAGESGETGSDEGVDGEDGEEGAGDTDAGATASTTDTNASSTEPGTTGESGDGGSEGDDGEVGETSEGDDLHEDESDPIPFLSVNDIGEDSDPNDGEDMTGGVRETGQNVSIETGDAKAQGEVETDVNSNNIRSLVGDEFNGDLDVYTFHATGTNRAEVETNGTILSTTGENTALANAVTEIVTGEAISALNIANVVNTNIVNSEGYVYLVNQIMEDEQALDLTDFFFPEDMSVLGGLGNCSLLSCMAEDINYNVTQMNYATITNDAILEAVTGDNRAEGDYVGIETGNAYAGANIINVVNSNFIDSNYRMLTLNAVGDLEGDLMLPTAEGIHDFFARPNGMSQTEDAESITIAVENINDAEVENNLDTLAETGENESTTFIDASIVTGDAESESNVLNQINENFYGGDTLYILIRVHGWWSGDVLGLPEGLTWEWTPLGIVIYNEDAEIAPSEFLGYDIDSYNAYFANHNDVLIENNVNITALTGENEIDGLAGTIATGDAYASANV